MQNPYSNAGYAPPPAPHGAPNPYASPAPPHGAVHGAQPLYRQNVYVPQGAHSAPLPSPGLRKAKLVLGILQMVSMFVGIGLFIVGAVIGPDDGGVFMGLGGGFFALWYMLLMAYGIVGMVWTYKFWSWIPPEQRHTNLWKKYISPGTALGFMFIPYFNIYWMFVLYLGIADILERMRVQYPTDKGPAKNLALMRLIVPMLFFPAAPFLDFYFDRHVEGMASDMQRQIDAQLGLGQSGGMAPGVAA
jgi:hypothetical protein